MQAAAQHKGIPANRYTPRSNRKPISSISNRYTKLLEFGVTYRKQTTGVHYNRYKYALSFARHSTAHFEKISAIGAQSQLHNEVRTP
jgi:hypothetical protein